MNSFYSVPSYLLPQTATPSWYEFYKLIDPTYIKGFPKYQLKLWLFDYAYYEMGRPKRCACFTFKPDHFSDSMRCFMKIVSGLPSELQWDIMVESVVCCDYIDLNGHLLCFQDTLCLGNSGKHALYLSEVSYQHPALVLKLPTKKEVVLSKRIYLYLPLFARLHVDHYILSWGISFLGCETQMIISGEHALSVFCGFIRNHDAKALQSLCEALLRHENNMFKAELLLKVEDTTKIDWGVISSLSELPNVSSITAQVKRIHEASYNNLNFLKVSSYYSYKFHLKVKEMIMPQDWDRSFIVNHIHIKTLIMDQNTNMLQYFRHVSTVRCDIPLPRLEPMNLFGIDSFILNMKKFDFYDFRALTNLKKIEMPITFDRKTLDILPPILS
ncbi:unnamed protein product [Ambrosiozyma monospora]|uniref:Unnamed protein product n=1 Tax=Ambrosiozyma monospora TaxID=43982 RepID=A0ACB5SS27_AMBMO|nr:unnamed protein product [Ambrosiozyma monospora]